MDMGASAIDTSNRVAKVRVSYELLSDIFAANIARNVTIETNAPSDLRVVGIRNDPEYSWRVAYMYFESAENEPVPEGAEPPLLPPFKYRRVTAGVDSRAGGNDLLVL